MVKLKSSCMSQSIFAFSIDPLHQSAEPVSAESGGKVGPNCDVNVL